MEPFIVEIEPSTESDYKLSSHEGEEFIYVLNGKIEINYGKEFIPNRTATVFISIRLLLIMFMQLQNQKAKILAVIYYPV